MSDILSDILSHKREETSARMRATPIEVMRRAAEAAPPPKAFAAALTSGEKFPVIAEIKKRSPSKGVLCENFSPANIAKSYANGNAACLSVLTDEKFFGGCADDLKTAAAVSKLPVLRKDFILNKWQIAESRAMGADALLLIAAAMSETKLRSLAATAQGWGMTVLVETHNPTEAHIAAKLPDDIIVGINNRDLKTFQTDLQITLDLLPLIRRGKSSRLLVSESGIRKREDIELLRNAGVGAFLIGETLMREPETALAKLFGEVTDG